MNKFVEHILRPAGYYTLGSLSAFSFGVNFAMAHPMADRYTQKQIMGFSEPFFHVGGAAGLILGGYVGQLSVLYGVYTLNSFRKLKRHKLK